MHSLDLSTFRLESAVIEVRYNDAYTLWDRAGAAWTEIAEALPSLVLKAAQPASVTFQLDREMDLAVELTRSVVSHYGPDAELERLAEVSSILLEKAMPTLRVLDFTRVGLRLRYWKDGESDVSVSQLVPKGLFASTVTTSPIGKDAEMAAIELATRWEEKSSGLLVALRTQSRKLNLNIPAQFLREVELRNDREQYGLLLDFDYFTKGLVASEQLRPKLWIPQALKVIRQAHRRLLEI